MPLASQLGLGQTADDSSELEISTSSTPPRAQALSVINHAPAEPFDTSSSGPVRRSSARARSASFGPLSRGSLRPSPSFASDLAGPSSGRPPVHPSPSQPSGHSEVHLHQHRQQVLNVGVGPVIHAKMQAQAVHTVAAVQNQAEAAVTSVISQAQTEVHARTEATNTVQHVYDQAQSTIRTLRTDNERLGQMNLEMQRRLEAQAKTIEEQKAFSATLHSQLIALQTHVHKAETQAPRNHNGTDQRTAEASSAPSQHAVDALQALAGEVGGTMRRIEQALEVALSPKAKAKKQKAKAAATAKAIAPSVALPIPAKASGSSGFVAPSPVEFGLPPYQCNRSHFFTGRLHRATPVPPPPPPSSSKKLKPQVFDVADDDDYGEPDEGEDDEEEDFEDDPIIPVVKMLRTTSLKCTSTKTLRTSSSHKYRLQVLISGLIGIRC